MISIILPVHNQADHLPELIYSYQAALKNLAQPYEFVLVENNSRDDSLAVAHQLQQAIPSLQVIHSDAGGWGLAVKLGLKAAQGDLICYTNSARTSPEDLFCLLEMALTQRDTIIKASRPVRDNWQRYWGSWLYNLQCRILFGLRHQDVNGTPKVFPRHFAPLMNLTYENDLIDAEFCAIVREQNYPLVEVPILSIARHSGKSTTGYGTAYRLYTGVFALWWERRVKKDAR